MQIWPTFYDLFLLQVLTRVRIMEEDELLPDQEHPVAKDRRVHPIPVVAEVAVEVVLMGMVQYRRGDFPMEVKFQGLSQTFLGGW